MIRATSSSVDPTRNEAGMGPTLEEARMPEHAVPTIEHAGMLEDLRFTPAYIDPDHRQGMPQVGHVSCSYCGVGDSGKFEGQEQPGSQARLPRPGTAGAGRRRSGTISMVLRGKRLNLAIRLTDEGMVEIFSSVMLTSPGGVISGDLSADGPPRPFMGRATGPAESAGGDLKVQRFEPYSPAVKVTKFKITEPQPTTGCVKLRISTMHQRSAYRIHTAPSILDPETGKRVKITYRSAISRLADMVLDHRKPKSRSLIYGSGQIDYFTIFAMQEVFRLLGVRNLTGNAEHCLNAGAVHNEVLTGQEGPFLTIDQAVSGPNRIFLMNGWNGMITHPPVYRALTQRRDLDGYLVDVMVTETAKGIAQKIGVDRIMLIRPRSDAHVALAVAHEIFKLYPEAVEQRFVDRFSDQASFERFKALATSATFAPQRVAERIAPEPQYAERLLKGIRMLAVKMSDADSVPIVIPSVGLSQTSGIVAHCLWGNVLGMLGKYGLKADGTPAGGVLRVPGQINAESEVQGLSRKYFLGRIPMEYAAEAARRMDLPDNAYLRAAQDPPRTALDYSQPTPGERELFLFFGTQFEANMPNRQRWLEKLQDRANSIVVIDPIPGPYSEKHADLIIPSPPHPATTKLYQNGEWKLSLSVPQKRPSDETRSDATIIYDLMAEITERLEKDPALAQEHADLLPHLESGYLRKRFCAPEGDAEGLLRPEGEVSRRQLWDRVQSYLHGGCGPLYCSFDDVDGRPIAWEDLVEHGSVVYGGVGTHRYKLDYDDPQAAPFRDIFRNPRGFRFFLPTEVDLGIPEGIIFNSGRSTLTDDRQRIHFATSTFNSGKATPVVKMPDEHPLFVSPALAKTTGLETGDVAKVTGTSSNCSITLPVVVSDRVKGNSIYVCFHRSKAQDGRQLFINDVTDHIGRCPYSAQTQLKVPLVTLERVAALTGAEAPAASPQLTAGQAAQVIAEAPTVQKPDGPRRIDMTALDTEKNIPQWTGTDTPLYVTDVFQETHDVYTFRFQGDPLCRFVFKPGQFCSLVLDIDGKRVVRSYSISSAPTRPYTLELTIKRVPGGMVSNWMPDNLKVGDRIHIKGPKGKFCLEPGKIPPKMLLIGAGSGVTPVMAMARWLCDISAEVDIKFYCSVRSSKDIIFGKEIEMMTERYRIFTPCVISTTRGHGEPWTGLTGRVSRQMLEMIAPDLKDRHIFMCGPNGFMDAVKDHLRELDFPLAQLHSESFGGTRTSASPPTASTPPPMAQLPGVLGESVPPAPTTAPKTVGDIVVQFAKTGRRVNTDGQLPLLDLAEEHDIDIEYGCRAGSCGDCKVRVLEGKVGAETDEGLTEEEVKAGYVLTCVANPTGNCVIDA